MKLNAECRVGNAESSSREAERAGDERSHSLRTPQSEFRIGFTLIELLVAITIIASLSALFLGASRAAMEHSRSSRTKTTISKLHTLLMERYADYETRRVDLDSSVEALIRNPSMPAEGGHDLRLLALRELMKFEMPDRWSDIDLTRNPLGKPTIDRDKATVFLKNVPTVARIYDRRYQEALANNTRAEVLDNQGAECLYQIIMLHTGDGEARTMFSSQDIGDIDEDGLPEFLDGWGQPIEFIRWAPGMLNRSSLITGDTVADHDPFDPFRRNWVDDGPRKMVPDVKMFGTFMPYVAALRGAVRPSGMPVGFRTVPLIVSRGPDGELGLVTAREVVTSALQASGDEKPGLLNPYFPNDDGKRYSMGSVFWTDDGEDLSIDNIHNHLQDTR